MLAIFLARVLDVSLGTVRAIFDFRGRADFAAIISFVGALIWIVAAGQVLSDFSAWFLAIAHAPGFAKGNIVGTWLEAKLALGRELVRAVSEKTAAQLADKLREARTTLWFDSRATTGRVKPAQ